MLRLDLTRLDREGSVRIEAELPPDDPLWKDCGIAFAGPVHVGLRALTAGTGEIVVRGRVRAEVSQECRRCLRPVPGLLEEEVTTVFVPSSMEGAEEDGDVRVFDGNAAELDLREPVREEVLFAADPYVVCDPECKGLCPGCGVDRNTETCSCVSEEADPRWDALRALKKE